MHPNMVLRSAAKGFRLAKSIRHSRTCFQIIPLDIGIQPFSIFVVGNHACICLRWRAKGGKLRRPHDAAKDRQGTS